MKAKSGRKKIGFQLFFFLKKTYQGWLLFKVALVSRAAPRGPVRTEHVTIHDTCNIWLIWYKLKVFRGDLSGRGLMRRLSRESGV